MKINKIICLFSFLLILSCIGAHAGSLNDTLRLHPIVKKKKPYPPLQPLVIKTCPTAILWGGVFPYTSEYRIMVEMTSSRTQSEQVSMSVLGTNIFLKAFEKLSNISSSQGYKSTGWRLQYAHKFYLVNHRHRSPYGFYVAPIFSYTDAHVAIGLSRYYHQVYYDFRNFSASGIIGVQVGKLNRLTLDLDAGLGYKNNTAYYHASSSSILKYDTGDFGAFYNSHTNLIFDLNIGYSF